MSRWLLAASCLMVLAAVAYIGPTRAANARPLGGQCATDRDCQLGLSCASEAGVMEKQCAAPCNATESCQERFGAESMCLAADLCARTCEDDASCPPGATCNAYGWCERAAAP